MTAEQKLNGIAKTLQDMIERNEWRIDDAKAEADRERETIAAYIKGDVTDTNSAEIVLAHAQRLYESVSTMVSLGKENRRLLSLITKF